MLDQEQIDCRMREIIDLEDPDGYEEGKGPTQHGTSMHSLLLYKSTRYGRSIGVGVYRMWEGH